jgi:hypothetical protein
MNISRDTVLAGREKIKFFLMRWWAPLLLLAILPVYYVIAVSNERLVDYVNNGFFTFWLSGRLPWLGQSPYSSLDWVNAHHANGATWIPNTIFPYPLPLVLITLPLGMFPIEQAYILWDTLAQVLIALCILWLATRWEGFNRQIYAVFLIGATVLNGNVYLGLMTGTFAALFLFFLTLALFFMETRRPLLAGMALASLALKPPLLMIVGLIGIWLLFKHYWKVIGGLVLGGLGLLVIGLVQDPAWVQKFLGAGESLLNMRVGNQPTILSYTRLACAGRMDCSLAVYGVIVVALIGLFAWLVWRKRETLSPIMVFSAAAALGLLLPPYIWSYDYTLLLIPICYIAFDLIRRRETYLHSTVFLLLLDVLSLIGLALFWMNPASDALTIQRDMWSIWVVLLVLGVTWWMVFGPVDKGFLAEKQPV